MKSPDLNSCFFTATGGFAATTGFATGDFGGSVFAVTGTGFAAGFGGGAFGGTSFRAGGGVFFFTAAVISKTFQAFGTKQPHRPKSRAGDGISCRTETVPAQSDFEPFVQESPQALRRLEYIQG